MSGVTAGTHESRLGGTPMKLTIRPATSTDLDGALELLRAANLPVADLSAQRLALVAEKDWIFQGVIGIE